MPEASATFAAPAAEITTPTPAPEVKVPTVDEALQGFGKGAALFDEKIVEELESGDPERIAVALGRAPKVSAPVEDAPAVPNPTPTEPVKSAEEIAGEKQRVSIKALKPEDRARTVQALELIRTGAKTPAEAFAEVFGIQPQAAPVAPAAAPAQAAPVVEPPAAVHPKVAELEAQLATLQEQYRQAKSAFDPNAADFLEQMQDVKIDLRDARREAAAEAQQVQTQAQYVQQWRADEAASNARALDQFSDIITSTADLGRDSFMTRWDVEFFLAQSQSDPILQQADWPEKIGQRTYDNHFKGKAANSPEPARGASPTIPPAPRPGVRLPGSPVGSGYAAGGLSQQAAMAAFAELPADMQIEQLIALEDALPKKGMWQ
jgi:hypothetical protein